jgi:lysophospholipase L1-like esterase
MTILFSISVFFPSQGINLFQFSEIKDSIAEIKNFTLKYPSTASLFSKKESNKVDISKIIELADAENILDSLGKREIGKTAIHKSNVTNKLKSTLIVDPSIHNLVTSIQFKDGKKGALNNFFLSLSLLNQEEKCIRILHYGDSQIEGDRITDYLRLKLQNQFGGEGPGFISACPLAQANSVRVKCSENFERYNVFIGRDSRTKHTNYGVAAGFCRFLPPKIINDSTKDAEGSVKIVTLKNGGPKIASYKKVKMYYGGAQKKISVEFLEGGLSKQVDSLQVGGNFNIKTWNIANTPGQWEVKFKGKDSPDIYGFSLEGEKGVMVDNFGLRGSSGTFFNHMNLAQLENFYADLNVKLIILQFGGNTLPYTKDSIQTVSFGKNLKSQIISIKKILPNVSILLIGPSDMGVKVGTEYVTHPQLENLRDAIKRCAFDTDSAFWDMYEVMGGKNSMTAWVEQQIAASDYIHFSIGGARKISTLLYAAFISEYNNYLNFTAIK